MDRELVVLKRLPEIFQKRGNWFNKSFGCHDCSV